MLTCRLINTLGENECTNGRVYLIPDLEDYGFELFAMLRQGEDGALPKRVEDITPLDIPILATCKAMDTVLTIMNVPYIMNYEDNMDPSLCIVSDIPKQLEEDDIQALVDDIFFMSETILGWGIYKKFSERLDEELGKLPPKDGWFDLYLLIDNFAWASKKIEDQYYRDTKDVECMNDRLIDVTGGIPTRFCVQNYVIAFLAQSE